MTIKTSLVAAATMALFAVSSLQAQTSTAPAAAADTKAGGQLSVPNQDRGAKPMPSQNSREDVKAQAKKARADGTIVSGEKTSRAQATGPTGQRQTLKTRTEVRAETAKARKAGEMETGQRSTKDQDRGGVKP